MPKTASSPTLDQYLSEPLRIGEPDVSGPLAVFPIFGPEPKQPYASFAQGRERGVEIKEVEHAASVNDLTVANPTDTPVLLYDGEEVLGAQQNRTLDITVLVAAGATIKVPVSCVEVGRWEHSRHADAFAPSPQTAYPELRRARSRWVRERAVAGLQARADQGEVWDEVAAKSARMQAGSSTGAMHDIYEQRRDRLGELRRAIELHDGQCGALVAVGGKFSVFDYVSRGEVFASLHAPLVEGYALDALEAKDVDTPALGEAEGVVSLICGAEIEDHAIVGLGRMLVIGSDGIGAAGLSVERELVQLTAFPGDEFGADRVRTVRGGSISRPSPRGE